MAHLLLETQDIDEFKLDALNKLSKHLSHWNQLPVKVVRLLVDQLLLINNIGRTTFKGKRELVDMFDNSSMEDEVRTSARDAYSDFSFMIAPSYKAFEGFLFFLAEEFGLPTEKYEHRIGGLYDLDANQKDKEQILEILKAKFGSDKEGLDRWKELSMVLRSYRHNPAHFLGNTVSTYEKAENYTKTIINTIDQTLTFLIENEILSINARSDTRSVFDAEG